MVAMAGWESPQDMLRISVSIERERGGGVLVNLFDDIKLSLEMSSFGKPKEIKSFGRTSWFQTGIHLKFLNKIPWCPISSRSLVNST